MIDTSWPTSDWRPMWKRKTERIADAAAAAVEAALKARVPVLAAAPASVAPPPPPPHAPLREPRAPRPTRAKRPVDPNAPPKKRTLPPGLYWARVNAVMPKISQLRLGLPTLRALQLEAARLSIGRNKPVRPGAVLRALCDQWAVEYMAKCGPQDVATEGA